MRWTSRFPAEWRNCLSFGDILRHFRAPISGSEAVMASPFSGALQLTDLDDFIGPSQVGRPRASRAEGGSGPGRAPRETSLTRGFSSARDPLQGPGSQSVLFPY